MNERAYLISCPDCDYAATCNGILPIPFVTSQAQRLLQNAKKEYPG
jgi:hypothetical protein